MESNSDNQLRDKLAGIQPQFDPAAWDKMEALLDKKKKRRFFIWWWTGGIAAALLLTVGAYEAGRITEHNGQIAQNTEERTKKREPRTENTEPAAQNTKPVTGHLQNNNTPTEVNQLNTGKLPATENTSTDNPAQHNSGRATTGTTVVQKGSNAKANTPGNNKPSRPGNMPTTSSKGKKQKAVSTNNSTQPASGFVAFNPTGAGKSKTGKQRNAATTGNTPNISGSTGTSTTSTATPNPAQQEVEQLSMAAGTTTGPLELLYINRMEVTLLPVAVTENTITAVDKQEENVLPKTKKKVFNYSLGVAAHLSGATVGAEGSGAGNLFYKTPTWLAGFTHDFTFINRIAITNGIMYGQTSYEVKKPKAVSYAKAPLYYNSHISEVAIPIGIKVYPVVKNNFSFYINTGIINHIKLTEKFSYIVPADTPIANTSLDPKDFYPETNTFNGGISLQDNLTTAPATVVTTNDFSINNSKRYYASFYAGAGFAYTAKKHFVLFAEPVFYMGLQKIGVQDKHKYNLGITGGFRYQF